MSEQTDRSAPLALPDAPSLEWLRKEAKRHLDEVRRTDPAAKLADAQFAIAKRYGFPSWRALKAHVDSTTVEGRLVAAAKDGDVATLARILDERPELATIRAKPYGWTLLHLAARHLGAVDLLLRRGLDVDARERGDNTYAMHWAAAAGELDVVRRLADAGGDVVGSGDDHELEVIGWATCWHGQDDDAHRAVADFLVSRGARHHIFSAIALGLGDEVRRIVAEDPSALSRRMSRNENHQLPLHFAVHMNRGEMVRLLLELGADPLGVDGMGVPVAGYATAPGIDRPVMEAIRKMTRAELRSAEHGFREPRATTLDFFAALALEDWDVAERLLAANPALGAPATGALHLMAKQNALPAVRWLLDHDADPNGRWNHWDAEVTPLHTAIIGGHPEAVRVLLDAGADPSIRDSKHDGPAIGWARFFERPEIVAMLREAGAAPQG